jgi:hypothetical protein
MLYVVCTDGHVDELDNADGVVQADGILVCKDPSGRTVREYQRESVMMFGHDERIKLHAELARSPDGTGPDGAQP